MVATELTGGISDAEAGERFQSYWTDRTPLEADDVAQAVLYAVTTSPHVNVNEILLRPIDQAT